MILARKTRERERRRRELRRRLYRELAEPSRCLDCRTELEPGYRRCPGCGMQLLRDCEACGRPIHVAWRACAHCGDGAQPQLTVATASGAEA